MLSYWIPASPQTKTILLSLRPLFLLTSCLKWHFLLQWILPPEHPFSTLKFLSEPKVLFGYPSTPGMDPTPPSTRGGSWMTQTSQDTIFFDHSHWSRSGHVISAIHLMEVEVSCLGKSWNRSTLSPTGHKRGSKGTTWGCQPSNQPALEQRQHHGRQCEEWRKCLNEMLSHQVHHPWGLP